MIGLEGDNLLRQGGSLVLATGAVHVLNYLYHVAMSRALGPADYGALVVLLSLILLLAIPMNTLQTTIALRAASSDPDDLSAFMAGLFRLMRGHWLAAGLIGWALLALVSPWVAAVLQIPGFVPVIIVGGFLAIAGLLPAVRGLFQGTHAFGSLGATFLIESGGKLVIGLALVAMGLGLAGATAGIIPGALAALLYGLWVLPRPASPDVGVPLSTFALLREAGPIGLTLLLFTILTNADVIAVKVLFAPQEAGYYAAASTAGKVVIYATWPIWLVLFPVLGREGKASRKTRRGLVLGIGLSLLVGAPILALYAVAPRLVAAVLFGPQYLSGASLFLPLGLAMIAYQVALLGMSHELAVGRRTFLRAVVLSAVTLTGLLSLIPRTLMSVALTTLGVGLGTAALMSWFGLASEARYRAGAAMTPVETKGGEV